MSDIVLVLALGCVCAFALFLYMLLWPSDRPYRLHDDDEIYITDVRPRGKRS